MERRWTRRGAWFAGLVSLSVSVSAGCGGGLGPAGGGDGGAPMCSAPLGGTCVDGRPVCPAGSPTLCGASPGACVDLLFSASHCGDCGRAVPAGSDCVIGRVIPAASIAGGTFRMGDRGDTVTVGRFFLDVNEVSALAYLVCVQAGACTPATLGTDSNFCTLGLLARQTHPINCVDWTQAATYCAWRTRRLPTEEEWEWAARGRDAARLYPWGEEAPESRTCWAGAFPRPLRTCPAGAFPGDTSRDGIQDLAGNVYEWTSSLWQAGPSRVVRGGSWYSFDPEKMRVANRYGNETSERSFNIGFRCAKAP